ncbi:MAG: hypothetical protein WKF70_11040 [Chitinophagaceae bacterium]
MKGIYQEEVSVEKVEFSKEDKKRLKDGEVAFGESFRMAKAGKETSFYTHRSVNNQSERVEEGQYIVTFKNGSQKLMTEAEFKEQVTPSKAKESAAKNSPAIVLQTSDGPQIMLSKKKSEELLNEDVVVEDEKVAK